MEVFVLIEEWYHDNGTIIGIFKSKAAAIDGFKRYRKLVNDGTVDSLTSRNYDYKLLDDPNEDHDYEIIYNKFTLNEINPTYC